MGFTSPPTAVTGPLTSAQLNAYKSAIDAMTNPARAFLYQATTPTTIANSSSTWTAVTWDTAATDTASGWALSPNPSRYTAQTGWAGYYLCIGDVEFTGNAAGVRRVTFGHNGAAITGRCPGDGLVPNNGNVHLQVVHEVFLNVGDYVELFAQQSSGAGLATSISGVKTSSMSVCWKAAA